MSTRHATKRRGLPARFRRRIAGRASDGRLLPSYVLLAAAVGLSACGRSGAQRPSAHPAAAPAEPVPIGTVQGAAPSGGAGDWPSPMAGRTVSVRGLVTACILVRPSPEKHRYGFVVQNAATGGDGDPATSDALFVSTGGEDFARGAEGPYRPRRGDELVLRGRVIENHGLTTLIEPRVLNVVRAGAALEREAPPLDVYPPDDAGEAAGYWERMEGMRVRVPAGAAVVGPQVFDWWRLQGWIPVMHPEHPVARRTDPYTRRVFRDPHPLDNRPEEAFDDGNGYRIVLADHALRAGQPEGFPLLPRVRTFDTLTGPVTGVVLQSDFGYELEVDAPPVAQHGVDPAANEPPTVAASDADLVVATYNIENLYDRIDDPFDPKDYARSGAGVDVRLFDYVPTNDAEYGRRVRGIALQIVRALGAPDLLLLEEVEDQDIRRVGDAESGEVWIDSADGMPDGLQVLMKAIRAVGGPGYAAAYDRHGADDRGIVCAFLYRPDRLRLAAPAADDPLLGAAPRPIPGRRMLVYTGRPSNPRALNELGPGEAPVFRRPPQVACFERVAPEGAPPARFYAIVNHFKARPDAQVERRRAQAAFNAALVRALQAADPDAPVLTGGDLNVYPRPDDPLPRERSDQLAALYEAGLYNVYDRMLAEDPDSAYTYVWQGQAQTLDQVFLTPGFRALLRDVRARHVNSDFTADPAVPARACSDHDPVRCVFGPRR